MAKRQPKGLGDTIEKITAATGIKKAVETFSAATGIDCGCNERKEKLNALYPNFKIANCLDQHDHEFLKEFYNSNQLLTLTTKYILNSIYLKIFGVNLEIEGCQSCWRDYTSNLKIIFDAYTETE